MRTLEFLAKLAHGTPGYRGAHQNVLAGGFLDEAGRRDDGDFARGRVLGRDDAQRAAEVVGMAAREHNRRDRLVAQVLAQSGKDLFRYWPIVDTRGYPGIFFANHRKGKWMSADVPGPESSTAWEDQIRMREEELRAEFLAANTAVLEEILADGYIVNSPLQQVLEKPRLLELLRAGRIRHSSFEVVIEQIRRQGDVVVVMGRDSVVDPPDGKLSHRRFTNIWQCQAGIWRSIARHAHVVTAGK